MDRRERIVAENLSAPPALARLGAVVRHRVAELGRGVRARLPGARADEARVQPLRSENRALHRWMRVPYGAPGKPEALAEIPWDYVREHETRIPFLGLRESWYPALESAELPHNAPVPATLLGDAVVFFRDAAGRPCAIEDRCPHRNAMLSLGQVGIVAPGTITCRYHGMTFDGDGECIAFLTDGPESPVCGKIRARTYPTEELGGVVWIYMGEREPEPVLDAVPHAREVFGNPNGIVMVDRGEWPFSYLAALDNDVDLAHPATLHRTCAPFSETKLWGQVGVREAECGGTRVHWRDRDVRPHAGPRAVEEVDWHPPNIAFFPPGDLGPKGCGYFWAVPREVGSCARWFLFGGIEPPAALRPLGRFGMRLFFGDVVMWPGSPKSCSDGADAAMMASQGRVPRWDRERLVRTDVAVTAVRRRLEQAYARERAARASSAGELALASRRPESP